MTQKIIWDDRYSVGDAEMDKQHRRLIALCNGLADCVDDPRQDSAIRFHEILHELAEYARTHFSAEEALLDRTGYVGLTEHRNGHGCYEADLTEFMFSACVGDLDKAAVHRFVLAWWIKHILQSDMEYRDHLTALSR